MRGRRRRALAGLLLAVLAGCGHRAAPAAPPEHAVRGEYAVHGAYPLRRSGSACDPNRVGYPDIHAGTPVVVRDASGAVLRSATLQGGTMRVTILAREDCVFRFSLSLPERDAYTVEVGNRGRVTFTGPTLRQAHWRIDLAIGNYAPGI
jgi:hypothetical protein